MPTQADTPKTLFIIRTHVGDSASLAAFDRLRDAGLAHVVFCVDQRHGAADMQGRDSVGFDDAVLAGLGLYPHPKCGWLCGDYASIVTRAARPAFDKYWLIEPDVRFNMNDLAAFFDRFAGIEADYLAARFGRRQENWAWAGPIRAAGLEPYGGLFPVTRQSARAVDHVHAFRRSISANPLIATPAAWPNDEATVASALVAGGFTCLDFNDAGIPCHSEKTFRTIGPFDDACFAPPPGDGMIYHPVRPFDPWLKRVESRIADPVFALSRLRRRFALHNLGKTLSNLAAGCLDHPIYAEAALDPLLFERALLLRQEELRAPGDEAYIDDFARQRTEACDTALERRFAVLPARPQLATAHVVAGRRRTPQAREDGFVLSEGFALGRCPQHFLLPCAWDAAAGEMLFTMHLRIAQVLAEPELAAAQRQFARVVVRAPAASLPAIFGPRDAAASPVLVFSLAPEDRTLFRALARCVTARCVDGPQAAMQVVADGGVADKHPALPYYTLAPFWQAHLSPADNGRCVILLGPRAAHSARHFARAVPGAQFLYLMRERSAWARSMFRATSLQPGQVFERYRRSLQAIAVLRRNNVAVSVVFAEDLIADPAAVMMRIAGTHPGGGAALQERLRAVMHALPPTARTATEADRGGEREASLMKAFDALWAAHRGETLREESALG